MQRISWIGVGIMGKAMVRNLMKAGYEVHIYARHVGSEMCIRDRYPRVPYPTAALRSA